MNCNELKNTALAALKGKWASAVVGSIFVTAAMSVIMAPGYCSYMAALDVFPFTFIPASILKYSAYASWLLNIFLLYPFILGYALAHNDILVSGDDRVTGNIIRNTFVGYFRNVWAMFQVYVFTLLWTLLFIVPGIVKSLSYSMTPFVLKDYPELSAGQAIKLSMKMMEGHKMDLFRLWLSFLGWLLLCILTLGVGLLWALPYLQTAIAAFYQDVRNDYINR